MTSNFHHITNLVEMIMKLKIIFTIATISMLSSCDIKDVVQPEPKVEVESYEDGTYCADVTYYNPNTNRQSEYTLNVEVGNGKLTKILWSNGGWLDISHFTPPNLSSSGDCSFTSDKGYQYTVSITGSECLTTDNPKAIEGREGNLTRKQCADLYGASTSLFEAFLRDRKVSADDVIDDEDCERMHKSLESFERLRNLQDRINRGNILSRVIRRNGNDFITCQIILVKRYEKYYLMEITDGESTTGLTSFNPSIDGWQELMIQEKPYELKGVIVSGRILYSSNNKAELEEIFNGYCYR
jgi:hypothetical protein